MFFPLLPHWFTLLSHTSYIGGGSYSCGIIPQLTRLCTVALTPSIQWQSQRSLTGFPLLTLFRIWTWVFAMAPFSPESPKPPPYMTSRNNVLTFSCALVPLSSQRRHVWMIMSKHWVGEWAGAPTLRQSLLTCRINYGHGVGNQTVSVQVGWEILVLMKQSQQEIEEKPEGKHLKKSPTYLLAK